MNLNIITVGSQQQPHYQTLETLNMALQTLLWLFIYCLIYNDVPFFNMIE